MSFSEQQLNAIYDRTSGYCAHCHKKLAWSNYGVTGGRGAWSVDHSKAKARGGTDHGNNLFAACISCNSSKQDRTARSFRAEQGFTRPPLSRRQVEKKRRENSTAGVILGGVGGLLVAGPVGAVVGMAGGHAAGSAVKVRATERQRRR